MSGASAAESTSSAVTVAAATVTGERRKLQRRSLSSRRLNAPAASPSLSVTMRPRAAAIQSQPRIDGVIEEIDDEIDDHEEEGDEDEIGGHHRNIGEADRLDDEEAHTGPLKDRLGDDREGDDRAELKAGDRDHRHQRILERMAEMDHAVGQSARARE